MATTDAFRKRVDDMFGARIPFSRKRGRWTTSSTAPDSGRDGCESKLLGPFEKRKKFVEIIGSKNSVYPTAALPTLSTVVRHQGNGNLVPLPSSLPIQPFYPQSGLSASRISLDAAFADAESLAQVARLEEVHTDALQPASHASTSEDFVSIPRSELERANGILQEKNMRIAVLEEFNLKAMEKLERKQAEELKLNVELSEYKRLVDAKTVWSRDPKKPWRKQMYADGADPPSVLTFVDAEPSHRLYPAIGGTISDEEHGSRPYWKELFNSAKDPVKEEVRNDRQKNIDYTTAKLQALQLGRKSKVEEKPEEDRTLAGAFTALSDEEEARVENALRGSPRHELLVTHERSNIDITRADIQCLLPGAWLNDEVINVYMELLKEREWSDPDRFLKCHFFNTFFYNKLFKDKHSYDYKAVRRWTTQKKLGYSLKDCHKILVPIHQDIHWCLAVINIRDKRLEYLDSLNGRDGAVLDVLAKYVTDEAKDKDGKVLDTSDWSHVLPNEIPEQLNGCDCGVFMVKYADFHSRDAALSFGQDDMEYFRRKMVLEILNSKAT